MVSEHSSPSDEHVNIVQKKSGGRSSIRNKDGTKVPRKIHKAEREKLKRDLMNDLFSELADALELANQNNGKSSTLTDSIRIIRDLFAQVDALKKENSTLLAESQYVAVETSELKEENNAMEAQISKLKTQINEIVHSQPFWRSDPSLCSSGATHVLENNAISLVVDSTTQAAPVVGSVFMASLQNDPELYTEHESPKVSKPHPRYPSPSHPWPFDFLSECTKVD